jgi:hypothetical protein
MPSQFSPIVPSPQTRPLSLQILQRPLCCRRNQLSRRSFI